ncbi:hypothetical protein FBU30_008557 [Linnemannia zychae]|nr:hypothetical protein FBU30_008557 [Linnemannia zychae]
MEVLSTTGMTDSQDVFQRERHFESRIPVSKARRATTESVNRPNPRQNKSAPAVPRPIPKNNNKRTPITHSNSPASSYTFDDTITDPFAPSTPSTFTASMEPTGFMAARSTQETISASNDSFFDRAPKASPISIVTSDINTVPTSATKPFIGAAARSKDASASSLPRPRHEDMILPVVAKRIKEQGLHNHDVIAYSDDYNAPLYKAPSTPAYVGNPFASYDRMKAASSASLSQSKSPLESSLFTQDQDMDHNKTKQDSKDDYNQASTSASSDPLSSISTSEAKSDASLGVSSSKERKQKETVESQLQHQQHPYNDSSSSGGVSPVVTRPDRPRRARRNTERSTRHDQYATYVDYEPQSLSQLPQAPQSPQSRQEYLERTQQPSWDRPYLNNEPGQDPYAPPVNNSIRHETTQILKANDYQTQDSREQSYGQSPRSNLDQGKKQEYNHQSHGDQYLSHQYTEPKYQQDSHNHRQKYTINHQQQQQQQQHQRQQQYQPQQSYQQWQQTQEQQSYINNYYQDQVANQSQGYQRQQNRPQNTQSRPEMVQVEMSSMDNGATEAKSTGEQQQEIVKVDDENVVKKNKKGSVCCIVM